MLHLFWSSRVGVVGGDAVVRMSIVDVDRHKSDGYQRCMIAVRRWSMLMSEA